MPVPLKLVHDHEKDIEQSCLDGDYARFMELANVKWGYRLRGTNDSQTQQLLFRDDEAPDFQYSLDLVTPLDCKRFLHSHNGSITEFDEKSFLHSAVQGENVGGPLRWRYRHHESPGHFRPNAIPTCLQIRKT